jgi:FKBP-type peptidyl-prolyl cis-trans isomerase FkpA
MVVVFISCSRNDFNPVSADLITTDSGLKYTDILTGDGPAAEDGDLVSVHTIGWLQDGTQLVNTYESAPLPFTIGTGKMIAGFDEGVKGMRVGGIRGLRIPPELGYGEIGVPGQVPPNATLLFRVELMSID